MDETLQLTGVVGSNRRDISVMVSSGAVVDVNINPGSDQSGEPEKIDWAKFGKAFGWIDPSIRIS